LTRLWLYALQSNVPPTALAFRLGLSFQMCLLAVVTHLLILLRRFTCSLSGANAYQLGNPAGNWPNFGPLVGFTVTLTTN